MGAELKSFEDQARGMVCFLIIAENLNLPPSKRSTLIVVLKGYPVNPRSVSCLVL